MYDLLRIKDAGIPNKNALFVISHHYFHSQHAHLTYNIDQRPLLNPPRPAAPTTTIAHILHQHILILPKVLQILAHIHARPKLMHLKVCRAIRGCAVTCDIDDRGAQLVLARDGREGGLEGGFDGGEAGEDAERGPVVGGGGGGEDGGEEGELLGVDGEGVPVEGLVDGDPVVGVAPALDGGEVGGWRREGEGGGEEGEEGEEREAHCSDCGYGGCVLACRTVEQPDCRELRLDSKQERLGMI